MKLTSTQLAALRQIIEDRHLAFAVKIYGPRVVPPEVYQRLKDAGLVTDKDAQASRDAYAYGRVLQALNSPKAANMSFADFQSYLRQNPVPLSDVEQRAVDIAAARGAQYIVGLGNKVAQQTGQILIEADAAQRQRLQEDIRTEVSQGIAARRTVKDIKSAIGHKTADWTRDLDRIAATEVSVAMNEGLAAQVHSEHGADAEVAVRSRRGCCDQCQAAYKGADGAPIIFRLTDLQQNGTNVGKKRPEQKPVVPPYHPNCACTLVHVPRGHGFNEDNRMTPLGKKGIRPHLATTKSMAQNLDTLAKSQNSPGAPFSLYGLTVSNVHPAHRPKHYRATLKLGATAVPCLIGPNLQAAHAYIAHLPQDDFVLVGFHEPTLAAMALHDGIGQVVPPPGSDWSQIPLAQLAAQQSAAQGPGSNLEPLARAQGKAGALGGIDLPHLRLPKPPKMYRTLTARVPKAPRQDEPLAPHEAAAAIKQTPSAASPPKAPASPPKAQAVKRQASPAKVPVAPTPKGVAHNPHVHMGQKPKPKKRQPVLLLPQ